MLASDNDNDGGDHSALIVSQVMALLDNKKSKSHNIFTSSSSSMSSEEKMLEESLFESSELQESSSSSSSSPSSYITNKSSHTTQSSCARETSINTSLCASCESDRKEDEFVEDKWNNKKYHKKSIFVNRSHKEEEQEQHAHIKCLQETHPKPKRVGLHKKKEEEKNLRYLEYNRRKVEITDKMVSHDPNQEHETLELCNYWLLFKYFLTWYRSLISKHLLDERREDEERFVHVREYAENEKCVKDNKNMQQCKINSDSGEIANEAICHCDNNNNNKKAKKQSNIINEPKNITSNISNDVNNVINSSYNDEMKELICEFLQNRRECVHLCKRKESTHSMKAYFPRTCAVLEEAKLLSEPSCKAIQHELLSLLNSLLDKADTVEINSFTALQAKHKMNDKEAVECQSTNRACNTKAVLIPIIENTSLIDNNNNDNKTQLVSTSATTHAESQKYKNVNERIEFIKVQKEKEEPQYKQELKEAYKCTNYEEIHNDIDVNDSSNCEKNSNGNNAINKNNEMEIEHAHLACNRSYTPVLAPTDVQWETLPLRTNPAAVTKSNNNSHSNSNSNSGVRKCTMEVDEKEQQQHKAHLDVDPADKVLSIVKTSSKVELDGTPSFARWGQQTNSERNRDTREHDIVCISQGSRLQSRVIPSPVVSTTDSEDDGNVQIYERVIDVGSSDNSNKSYCSNKDNLNTESKDNVHKEGEEVKQCNEVNNTEANFVPTKSRHYELMRFPHQYPYEQQEQQCQQRQEQGYENEESKLAHVKCKLPAYWHILLPSHTTQYKVESETITSEEILGPNTEELVTNDDSVDQKHHHSKHNTRHRRRHHHHHNNQDFQNNNINSNIDSSRSRKNNKNAHRKVEYLNNKPNTKICNKNNSPFTNQSNKDAQHNQNECSVDIINGHNDNDKHKLLNGYKCNIEDAAIIKDDNSNVNKTVAIKNVLPLQEPPPPPSSSRYVHSRQINKTNNILPHYVYDGRRYHSMTPMRRCNYTGDMHNHKRALSSSVTSPSPTSSSRELLKMRMQRNSNKHASSPLLRFGRYNPYCSVCKSRFHYILLPQESTSNLSSQACTLRELEKCGSEYFLCENCRLHGSEIFATDLVAAYCAQRGVSAAYYHTNAQTKATNDTPSSNERDISEEVNKKYTNVVESTSDISNVRNSRKLLDKLASILRREEYCLCHEHHKCNNQSNL